jgi:hypothetical protein
MNKILSHGPGLMIGIPTLGRPVPLDWALAFKSMNPPINYNSNFYLVKGKEVADARNEIAENAVKVGAKYLFFLGDDVVCPPHTLRQLIFRLENNANIGIVGGVYCCKCDPSFPLVFRGNGNGAYWDWKIGEFFEVSGLGMDCTLIRTEVFEKVSKPWFKTVDTDDYIDGKNSAEQWTEDLFFLNKVAKETEWKIFCDSAVICNHWDVYADRAYCLPPDSLPMRRLVTSKGKKFLLLGPVIVENKPDDVEVVKFSDNDEDPSDYRGSYNALPFDSGQFDRVIVHDSIELNESITHEVKRVTKVAA